MTGSIRETRTIDSVVTDFFVFIYLILPAATNAQLEGCKRVRLSQFQGTWGEMPDFTKLSEQKEGERERERTARGGVAQSLGSYRGGDANWQ